MNAPKLKITRRTGAVAAAAAIVVGVAGWAFAEGELPLSSSSTPDPTTTIGATPGANGDNAAVATNTKDGKTVVAISLKIVQTADPVVDPANAAVAVASCSDCQTVAVALEGVLVIGDPTTFNPTNIALAINSDCTNCQTLAAAYQSVVQNDTRVRISGAGRQEIAAVRKDLNDLRKSGLDIFAIRQRVNEAAGRFLAVLQTEVIPVGKPSPSTTAPTAAAQASTTTTAPGSSATSTPTTTEPATTTTTTPPTTTAP